MPLLTSRTICYVSSGATERRCEFSRHPVHYLRFKVLRIPWNGSRVSLRSFTHGLCVFSVLLFAEELRKKRDTRLRRREKKPLSGISRGSCKQLVRVSSCPGFFLNILASLRYTYEIFPFALRDVGHNGTCRMSNTFSERAQPFSTTLGCVSVHLILVKIAFSQMERVEILQDKSA